MTDKYTVRCEWDDYNWVATVDGVPGAFTQGKRLDRIPDRMVEAIKLIAGVDVRPEDLEVVTHVDDEVDQVAADIARLYEDLAQLEEALASQRRRAVETLHDRGFPLRDIGFIAKVSYQRVHQLLGDGQEARR